jgi:glycosyltransferase involved in cell wall biosynthesis
MTRVVRIITRLNIGGPAIQATTLPDRLVRHGFETLLIYGRVSPGEGDMSYLLEGRRSRTAYIPHMHRSISPPDDARAFAAVYRLVREFRPDILHTHTAKAGAIGRTAALLCRRRDGTRIRTVHTYHGHVFEGYFRYPGVFIGLERVLAPVTDRLIGISPEIAAVLREKYRIGRPDQWNVIQLGFDLDAFAAAVDDAVRADARRALGIDAHVPTVTIVGRLTAIKQHDLFLRVARAVHDRDASVRFLIVGDGELRGGLERLTADLGLADVVRFLGWRKDLATVYAATDVCVLTSRSEGTPVALIEALASGVPVVSTDVGGVRDVVDSPLAGRIARDGDVDALASAVVASLVPAGRAPDLRRARRRSMVDRYGIDRLTDDIASLYRTLLAPIRSGGH